MLEASAARTAWVPKPATKLKLITALLLLAICLLAAWLIGKPHKSMVELNGQQITAEIAASPDARAIGLSKYKTLDNGRGMLFVHDQTQKQCFWMKDMKFPIDILWLGSDKQILYIEENVQSSTYPKQFCPDVPAKYVLEVNSGMINKTGVRVGQKLSF